MRAATAETITLLESETATKERMAKEASTELIRTAHDDAQLALQAIQQAEQQGLITRKDALAQKLAILKLEGNAAVVAYEAEKASLDVLISGYVEQKSAISATSPEYKKLTADIENLAAAYDKVSSEEKKFADGIVKSTAQTKTAANAQTTTWHQFFQKYRVDAQQAGESLKNGLMGAIDQLNAGIGNAFASWAVQGKSFGSAMMQVSGQILSSFVGMLVEMGLHWLESLLMQKAASAVSGVAQVTSNAAVAASGAMAATALIPFVGPALAPAAGVSTFAATMAWAPLASAAGGWDMVPSDQLASVHKNEMILPASIATPMRSMLKSGQLGGGGGDMHLHSNISIQALDGKSVQQLIAAQGDVIGDIAVSKMKKAMKMGAYR